MSCEVETVFFSKNYFFLMKKKSTCYSLVFTHRYSYDSSECCICKNEFQVKCSKYKFQVIFHIFLREFLAYSPMCRCRIIISCSMWSSINNNNKKRVTLNIQLYKTEILFRNYTRVHVFRYTFCRAHVSIGN